MDYTLVIVAAFAIGGSCVIITGRAGVRWGYLLWIASLGLGYRTLPATDAFKLHPSALILVGLFLWTLLTASSRVWTSWQVPLWVWLLIPFLVWGWNLGTDADVPWDEMLSELQNFVLLIPLFVVTATVVRTQRDWKASITLFYATATFIAALGLLEYFVPSIRGLFPQFVSKTDPYMAQDGFARAQFSFWGHQAATFLCAMAIPLTVPLLKWWTGQLPRILTTLAVPVLLAAVYLSGFRVLWMLVVLQFIVWLILNRQYALGVVATVASLAGYTVLPEVTQLRVESFILALQGTPVETSGADHLNRFSDAVNAIQDNPFGMGWTGSGWVHCDFVQIAANLGVIPGALFAAAFLWTVLRVFRLTLNRKHSARPLHIALALSLMTAGGIMSTQVTCVLPQLSCPIFFIWVLAALAVRQQSSGKEEMFFESPAYLRVASYIQLPSYSPQYARVGSSRG